MCRCSIVPSGRVTSTCPLSMTDHESSSSPSFMTTVPALSTTANTMTAHRARLVARVMLANAWHKKHILVNTMMAHRARLVARVMLANAWHKKHILVNTMMAHRARLVARVMLANAWHKKHILVNTMMAHRASLVAKVMVANALQNKHILAKSWTILQKWILFKHLCESNVVR